MPHLVVGDHIYQFILYASCIKGGFYKPIEVKCRDVCGVPRAVVVEPVVGDRLLGTTGPVTGHNGEMSRFPTAG